MNNAFEVTKLAAGTGVAFTGGPAVIGGVVKSLNVYLEGPTADGVYTTELWVYPIATILVGLFVLLGGQMAASGAERLGLIKSDRKA